MRKQVIGVDWGERAEWVEKQKAFSINFLTWQEKAQLIESRFTAV